MFWFSVSNLRCQFWKGSSNRIFLLFVNFGNAVKQKQLSFGLVVDHRAAFRILKLKFWNDPNCELLNIRKLLGHQTLKWRKFAKKFDQICSNSDILGVVLSAMVRSVAAGRVYIFCAIFPRTCCYFFKHNGSSQQVICTQSSK